jgi:hypothetical protein
MNIQNYLFVYDFSAIVIMVLLAQLSKGMGEALKIPPYFRLLYGSAGAVAVCFIFDTIHRNANIPFPDALTLAVRLIAGALALGVCLRYWQWLFSEFLKSKG